MTPVEKNTERTYCSQIARASASPLHGTAIQVDAWLMIEYSRPWRSKALEDNELPQAISTHLAELADAFLQREGVKLRPQFIKQAASDSRAPRVYFAQRDARGVPMLHWRQLASSQELLGLSVDTLKACADWQRCSEEQYFVCTNGQRDLCCARFGLPVYEAMRMHVGARAWQTSHVGGHRYAPNVLCLPSGVMYGFVNPETVTTLIDAHDQGSVALDHLRGFCWHSEVEQTADYWLRSENQYTACTTLDLETVADSTGDLWRVYVKEPFTDSVALAHNGVAEEAPASCGKDAKVIARYERTIG